MTWTHTALEPVASLLSERTGLCFSPSRQDSAEHGIARAMKRAQVSDAHEYCRLVEASAEAMDDLIAEVTVGETYFFREPDQFDFIRNEVVPDVLRRRGPGHVIRAWSAGCASGEEAYSLAIDFAEQDLAAHIMATDISRTALLRAQRAVYGEWSLRGEGGRRARHYLHAVREQYQLAENIRRRVTCAYLNLAVDVYPSWTNGTWGLDLILCRNVFIYLDAATVRRVANRFLESLAPGGWLMTASSDPPLGQDAPYETVVTPAGVFYRRSRESRAESPEISRESRVESTEISRELSVESPEPENSRALRVESPEPENSRAFSSPCSILDSPVPALDLGDPEVCAVHLRALASTGLARALDECPALISRHPLAAELHFLHTVLLLESGRLEEAVQAVRRVLYLDRSLALAHFTLGSILLRMGKAAEARRAFRNARDLCRSRPADEELPLAEGEKAARLAEAAALQMTILDSEREESS